MINKVILVGRTGKEPDTKHFDNGQLSNVSLATSEKYKNKSGETVENTEWHNLVFGNKLSEICEKYVTKGQLLYIEGKIRTRSYDDKDGNKKYVTEIIVLSFQMLSGSKDKEESKQEQKSEDPGLTPDDLPF